MSNRNSIVDLRILSAHLESRKFISGIVISSNDDRVGLGDSVIVYGPLASQVFQKAKFLPGNVTASVVLEPNPQENRAIWRVKSIEKIESAFCETPIDRLLELQEKYCRIGTEEIRQIRLEIVMRDPDFFHNPTASDEVEVICNRRLNARRIAFDDIIRQTLSQDSILGVAKDLQVFDTSSESPLGLLREIQERFLQISDDEIAHFETEVGLSMIRHQFRAIEIVVEKCKELLQVRHSRFIKILEKRLHISSKMPLIEARIESNPDFNPSNQEPRQLMGVVNTVKSYD